LHASGAGIKFDAPSGASPALLIRETMRSTPLPPPHDRAIAIWLLCCAAMIFAMVLIGGITRLTESGLSITEWKPVTGALPPLSQADWQAEFDKYRQTPQFSQAHLGLMTLDEFKSIYFWEYVHRLWGRLIGLAYALPLAWFAWKRMIGRALLPRLVGIFALGALQGFVGWFMVKSGLADRVSVSQYRLVLHLGLAIVIYAATLWVAFGLLAPVAPEGGGARLRRAASAVMALVFVTLLSGGFVAGLDAGLTYNTFPLMDGRLVPEGYTQLQPFWLNWFENVAAVQFDHRLLAVTTFCAAVGLWAWGMRLALAPAQRTALHLLLAAACLQVALGISTLLLVVPIPLAAAHQAGAVLLFTGALLLRHTLRAPTAELAALRPATSGS
jgi:cytochrome c oxidase assembly protein subunit 15